MLAHSQAGYKASPSHNLLMAKTQLINMKATRGDTNKVNTLLYTYYTYKCQLLVSEEVGHMNKVLITKEMQLFLQKGQESPR